MNSNCDCLVLNFKIGFWDRPADLLPPDKFSWTFTPSCWWAITIILIRIRDAKGRNLWRTNCLAINRQTVRRRIGLEFEFEWQIATQLIGNNNNWPSSPLLPNGKCPSWIVESERNVVFAFYDPRKQNKWSSDHDGLCYCTPFLSFIDSSDRQQVCRPLCPIYRDSIQQRDSRPLRNY